MLTAYILIEAFFVRWIGIPCSYQSSAIDIVRILWYVNVQVLGDLHGNQSKKNSLVIPSLTNIINLFENFNKQVLTINTHNNTQRFK